jgi:hypothetical protein
MHNGTAKPATHPPSNITLFRPEKQQFLSMKKLYKINK